MPKRNDLKKIMIIGSGPIIISQACEFDYSGTQACKALREEGYKVILVNSNPATIMTDPQFADATYIEPVTPEVVEKIIAKERPDALLPTLGGQTGLNVAVEVAKRGVLKKYKVQMIGADRKTIEKAEDRDLFKKAMQKIGLDLPRSINIKSMQEAKKAVEVLGMPIVIPAEFYPGRDRRRHRLQHEGIRGIRGPRPGIQHDPRGPSGRVGPRVERVRAGGHARPQGQCRHHMLHREF